MEKKAIVVYNSKRGSTKQYAEWISERLSCLAVPIQNFDYSALDQFDVIIFGGWLRGSGIVGFDKFRKKIAGYEDKLVVFVTGISEYNPENYMQICEFNFDDGIDMSKTLLYFCPGRYEPSKVTGLDKFLMTISKKILVSGAPDKDASAAANEMADAIKNGIDKVDERYIEQVLRGVRSKFKESENN